MGAGGGVNLVGATIRMSKSGCGASDEGIIEDEALREPCGFFGSSSK